MVAQPDQENLLTNPIQHQRTWGQWYRRQINRNNRITDCQRQGFLAMTECKNFLSAIKARGAIFAPPVQTQQLSLTNAALQRGRFAMLPDFLIQIYTITGGLNIGSGYIFGPNSVSYTPPFVIPSIIKVNNEIGPLGKTAGKTIFGRNDLFWFAYDAFGVCYMLDNLTLRPVKKYSDPYKAIADCLIAGKL